MNDRAEAAPREELERLDAVIAYAPDEVKERLVLKRRLECYEFVSERTECEYIG